MSKKHYDLLYKLLVIGDSGVGKTCLLFRFVDDTFQSTFISTIGIDFKIKTVEIDGKRIKLQIWDTAGQERFHTITTSYYRGAMGIMLVYDCTSRKSFDNITKWLRNIEEHATDDVERIIVGNKKDMVEKQQVSSSDAKHLAQEYNVSFIETSAKNGEGVDRAFCTLTEAILRKTRDFEVARGAGGASAGGGGGGRRLSGYPDHGGHGSGRARCCWLLNSVSVYQFVSLSLNFNAVQMRLVNFFYIPFYLAIRAHLIIDWLVCLSASDSKTDTTEQTDSCVHIVCITGDVAV